ncbi:predicted protein [Postia placenta Mad-698-R]|uniref:Uncharacterized protein n=1 Tax=Postia placenta MAD-698-R-SB12 TaxID=670580 RepID=A0A1X6NEW3_9APHY|nr:hypothetical protein POSPLADRAFT_1042437 [Postia placenta MAD-698-R-SB12]EED80852.1 predicted protein [Postia placenta Mad-698-R]OSX67178.1 hypothetical protein POSPLADRAFT_1042437 [Postia placenta MAD-698-R-SB12]
MAMQLTSSGPALAETAAWVWFDGPIPGPSRLPPAASEGPMRQRRRRLSQSHPFKFTIASLTFSWHGGRKVKVRRPQYCDTRSILQPAEPHRMCCSIDQGVCVGAPAPALLLSVRADEDDRLTPPSPADHVGAHAYKDSDTTVTIPNDSVNMQQTSKTTTRPFTIRFCYALGAFIIGPLYLIAASGLFIIRLLWHEDRLRGVPRCPTSNRKWSLSRPRRQGKGPSSVQEPTPGHEPFSSYSTKGTPPAAPTGSSRPFAKKILAAPAKLLRERSFLLRSHICPNPLNTLKAARCTSSPPRRLLGLTRAATANSTTDFEPKPNRPGNGPGFRMTSMLGILRPKSRMEPGFKARSASDPTPYAQPAHPSDQSPTESRRTSEDTLVERDPPAAARRYSWAHVTHRRAASTPTPPVVTRALTSTAVSPHMRREPSSRPRRASEGSASANTRRRDTGELVRYHPPNMLQETTFTQTFTNPFKPQPKRAKTMSTSTLNNSDTGRAQ